MVLISQPKHKKTSIHQKRRTGHHQHKKKDFHKPYWPYLPMIGIVAFGAAVNAWLSAVVKEPSFAATYNISATTRLQSWVGQPNEKLLIAILAVAALAGVIVILRHGHAWSKAIAKGEDFIIHHPFLDMALVALATSGFIAVNSLV